MADSRALVPARELRPDFPLSYGQQALWFLEQLAPGNGAYVIGGAARLAGDVDPAALARACRALAARHSALRTTFHGGESGPRQRVAESLEPELLEGDCRGEDEIARRLEKLVRAPFDLARGPLWRVGLWRLPESWVLALAVHHIVSDFWSLGVMVRELGALYAEESGGAPAALAPPALTYHEWVAGQEELLAGPEGERLWRSWREALAGTPLVLDLPADRPRPEVQSYAGAALELRFPAGLVAAARRAGRKRGATLFMVLLAAFQALLGRLSGQERLVVGTPTTGRRSSRVAGLVGYLVNPVAVAGDLAGDPTFAEHLGRVRAAALAAFDLQEYPFALLAERLQPERDPARSPVFQVMLVLQKGRRSGEDGIAALSVGEAGAPIRIGPLAGETLPLPVGGAQLDLSLAFAEVGQGLGGRWVYNVDLFEAATVERLGRQLGVLLEGLLAGGTADARVWEAPLLGAEERAQLLGWGRAPALSPERHCLHELVAEAARQRPDAVAAVFEGQALTLGELVARARRLAHRLRRLGVGPEVRVGVCADRSLELVVGLLAVLEAGGAYVPLDPGYPDERLRLMLEDSGARVLLGQDELLARLAAPGVERLPLEAPGEGAAGPLASGVSPANAAYAIYTSGSTGRPKGVVVSHRAVAHRVWCAARTDLVPGDGFLQKTAISFDVSVLEVFAPLVGESRVVLPRPGGHQDTAYLVRLMAEERVTYASFPPTTLSVLLEQDALRDCRSLRVMVTGGEAVPADLPGRFHARVDADLVNRYGPTEATISVTSQRCGRDGGRPPAIGRPVAGAEVYLLDERLQPVPPGMAGEIHIGGVLVARGYHGRPDLTAERFVPDPFAAEPGRRLYRTGDLGRFRPDGAIEFAGRIDHQVKIRGFRIEPGEIQVTLAAHPDLREVAVVDRPAAGGRELVAFFVPGREAPAAGELRRFLAGRLPAYMVPSAFVLLAEMPLSPTGKVDRRALAQLGVLVGHEEKDEAGTARTTTQEVLAAVWEGLLGRERVGLEESFFDLGGHSLLAAQLVSRVREAFGVELPLRRVFEAPTVAALAAAVEEELGVGRRQAPPIRPLPRPAEEPWQLPLSFAQERLWFLDRLDPGSAAYVIPAAVRLTGSLAAGPLAAALAEVARRHEALRTRFAVVQGRPVQVVEPARGLDLPLVDLAGLPPRQRQGELARLAGAAARRPFDLERGPLLRAALVRLSADEHALLLAMHHIVSDGWSVGVLAREVSALYEVFAAGRPSPLRDLPVQYADYAAWQREHLSGEALADLLDFWRGRLAGAPALLELPADRPRPPVQRFRGGSRRCALAPDLGPALGALGRRQGTTPFMALLAAFDALLLAHTGQEDLVVGTPVAGRTRAEVEDLIGLFLNTLVLRADLSGDPSFRDLLVRVREATLSAYAHQDLPFEKLVDELQPERSLAHAPLFQAMVVLQGGPPPVLRLSGIEAIRLDAEGATAKLDLVLNLTDLGGGLAGWWFYNRDLFDPATIDRIAAHFEALLAAAVAAPDRSLSELPLLTPAEEQQLLEWNATGVAYPEADCPLHELIEAQARRTPEAIAVSFESEALTYRGLEARAAGLAGFLRSRGVGPEDRVGIAAERSLELVVGLLAILKAGGAYVPLDPSYPEDRRRYMLEDSRVSFLLTQQNLAGLAALPATRPRVHPDNLAYVIYTSGSTGRPKGAMNTHRGIVNRLLWMQERYGLTPEDAVLQKTPFGFDVSVWEFFWPLLVGARLVVARPGGHQDGAYLVGAVVSQKVTTLHFVPSMLRVFVETPGVERCACLRRVIASGEALPYELQQRFFEKLSGAELHNLYGPTEAAVDVTSWACERERGRALVPIGHPVANTAIHLLDRHCRPVPLGVAGELYIGGVQLARGYWNRPELTAERFVPDPLSSEPGARLYRTGDLARRLPAGEVDYLGRVDHQVKVRGFRIELGEIESALLAQPGVREAVVVARQDGGAGGPRLVAYVSGEAEGLREALAASLPEYMVPAAFVVLDRLPLSPNGKVDRKALPAPEAPRLEERRHVPPRTALERELCALFEEVLEVERVGVEDSFFELGGNSISGAILINRLQERLGEIVHVVAIFDHPTVARLAAHLGREHAGALGRSAKVDEGRVALLRSLVRPLSPLPRPPARKNPRAIFVLAPPRSGTTLLRVMLAGHPELFAPPELELLGFNSMGERRQAFSGRDSFWLEGLIRAVMEVKGCGPDEAKELLAACEEQDLPTPELYGRLQGWLNGCVLVDKTPSYALDSLVLARAEEVFEDAFYVHLLRHPYGMIHSFEEARLEQVFFRYRHELDRRELAELVWLVSHENVLGFLAGIPPERQHRVVFEDLVREPERVLRGLCAALGVDYRQEMADPYGERKGRMTDGVHAASRMLGDVKFHSHRGVEAAAAERWREAYRNEDFLGEPTRRMAKVLGYLRPMSRIAPRTWAAGDTAPLSFAQERLWFLDQLEPGSWTYNIPVAVRMTGRLDVRALAASLAEVLRRHTALRTRFAADEGKPYQVIAPPAPLALPLVDLTGLPDDGRETEARRQAAGEARRPFDLQRSPLLRTALLRLAPDEHVALLTMHHIASDGWSVGVLVRELATLYASLAARVPPPLLELPIQYADYALWQREHLAGPVLDEQLAYWRRTLAGLEPLRLPIDRPRPAVRSSRGATAAFRLPRPLADRLAAAGRAQGASLYMVLLAGFGALLSRYSGQDDLAVGSPVAGRTRAELEGLIGFFVNTLVMRADLSGDPSFRDLLDRVRRTALDAFAHQDVPFERVVEEVAPERDLGRTPLFQVLFVLQNASRLAAAGLPGLALRQVALETTIAKFDLTLSISETPQGLAGSLEYSTDLFEAATLGRLAGHLETLLTAAAAGPDRGLAELPLLTEPERVQLLGEWRGTRTAYPRDATLHELFAERAARAPGAVALVLPGPGGEERWTYGELAARAAALARLLRARGVGPETVVAVLLERSADLIASLLGIVAAGGAYLPLDPASPPERLARLLADAAAPLVLTREAVAGKLTGTAAEIVLLDREPASASGTAFPASGAGPDSLAYVLYTSGSTGTPKGVAVPHRAVVRLVEGSDFMDYGPGEVFLQLAPTSFDASTLEIWGALLHGARLVVPPPGAHSLEELGALLQGTGVTALWLTAGLFHQMVDAAIGFLRPVRQLLAGGDVLSPAHVARALRELPGTRLVNGYGPTENTTFTCCHPITRPPASGETVPVGRPIANTEVLLLDRSGQPAPVGVPGELCAGGDGLARGYLGRPDLTAAAFVPHPCGRTAGERLYRTGDLARWRPDGTIEFLGRLDAQVKVRGFRIEPGEIEAALVRHPEVREAAVVPREDRPGDRRLVAYVAARPAAPPALVAELRTFLGELLPDFMVPSAIVIVDELPLTANGKVDRGALLRTGPAPEQRSDEAHVAPRTAIEEVLAGMWTELLGIETVGVRDDFFRLGGHSLLATQLVSRLRSTFRVELPLRRLFEAPAIETLAAAIADAEDRPGQSEKIARALLKVKRLSAARRAALAAGGEGA